MKNNRKTKVMIVGANDTAYQLAFLCMNQLKMEETFIFQSTRLNSLQVSDLASASTILSYGQIKMGKEKDYTEADVLVLTASEEYIEEESEDNYLRRNIRHVRKIVNHAMANGFNGMILVATDPTDLFTYLVWKFSGLPKTKVFGIGTYIDTLYLQHMLSEKLQISLDDAKGYVVGGSRPDHKIVAWSRSYAGGMSVLGLTVDSKSGFKQEDMFIIEEKIVEKISFTAKEERSFTKSAALVKLIQFVLNDKKAVVPLTHLVDFGGYKNIPLSLPVTLFKEGIRPYADFPFSELEKKELLHIAKEVREQLDWIEKG